MITFFVYNLNEFLWAVKIITKYIILELGIYKIPIDAE